MISTPYSPHSQRMAAILNIGHTTDDLLPVRGQAGHEVLETEPGFPLRPLPGR